MIKLEEFLPYRLSVLANQVSQGIARIYAERFGLSITEWRVIAILGRFEDIPAAMVAERSAMDKVAVSRAVRRLLDAKLIQRREGSGDRREKPLALTEPGRRVYGQVAPAALAFEERLLDSLTAAERRSLDKILDKLLAASRAAASHQST
ncbi:MAG: MarR family winged helix-turn-helix transcriptional regulator [Wenzhouxiangella sp.]